MDGLKPCPFCGGKGKFVDATFWGAVICEKCYATTASMPYSAEYAAFSSEEAADEFMERLVKFCFSKKEGDSDA